MSQVDEVRELPASIYAQDRAEDAELVAAEVDDFDTFWSSQNAVKPARIRGRVVTPPTDVPLALLNQLDQVEGSTELDDIKRVLAVAYGEPVVDHWSDAGMGVREFQVVLAWTGAAMRGKPVDFATAQQLATEAAEAAERTGKGGTNRAARRFRKKSGGTGG
jgi:hypothetical protein